MRRALGFKLSAQAHGPDGLRRLLRAASTGTHQHRRRGGMGGGHPAQPRHVVVGAPVDGGPDLRPAPVGVRPGHRGSTGRCVARVLPAGDALPVFTRGDPAAAAGCGCVDPTAAWGDLPLPAGLARRQRHADRGGMPTRPGRRRPARGANHDPGLQVREIQAIPVVPALSPPSPVTPPSGTNTAPARVARRSSCPPAAPG